MKSRPEPAARSPIFELADLDQDMRQEDAYARDGHTARTLVREPDLRVVFVTMRAGARLAEHRAKDTAAIHALSGHVRLQLPDGVVDLPAGRLLVLERGVHHDVEAVEESSFLITLAWPGSSR
ncbi:MAG TPA: hypothetical protein VKZ49_12105 [Polyangiaceae bacterium]|nr:hypothetical protein [Polyangiaceae bacterium]